MNPATRPTTRLPPAADPLGETLHLLRLDGTLYCRAELTAPWGIGIPRLDGMMAFLIVTAGSCRLEIDGDRPRVLEQGGFALIPHGTPHQVRSDPDAASDPLFDLPVNRISDRYETMHHGGGGALTQVTYGVLRFDHVAAHRLVAQLPTVVHIDSWRDDDSDWLHHTVRFIAREARELRPGGETVITRLADVLVIQAIRTWLESSPEVNRGWLAAVQDEQIGPALRSMHRAPGKDWTVASLAGEANMSRSAFSARFSGLVGEPVMQYLTHWRMQLAHTYLRESTDALPAVAERFGYQSEAAFCRAFKRTFGVPPGSVRHAGVPSSPDDRANPG